jgi:glyoxylase-like metal-dependent hydrolase (beta-lactamase superfamily II)
MTGGVVKGGLMSLGAGFVCPGPSLGTEVNVSVLNTGWVHTEAQKVSADVKPGKMALPLLVGKIEHPAGNVYVDAGLGKTTRNHTFPRFPLSSKGAEIPPGFALAEQASETPGLVLMTHLHYDHVGGLLDLTQETEVWTTTKEWTSRGTSNVAFPEKQMLSSVRWNVIQLEAGHAQERLGRPAVDVRGDGTIWYLSTPGHTPGAASVLVHASNAAWLFIGDIAWVDAHLESQRRPKWVSIFVDGRPKQQRSALAWARQLRRECPSLQIIPGHEARWTNTP